MDAFLVRGGGPLRGTIRVNGAKNSALKLVAAALLAPGEATIRNVPDIADMRVMGAVLAHLGVGVRAGEDGYHLSVPDEIGDETPAHLVSMLRASIIVLGPLLARCGHARLAMPGGCNLGNRSIDMHLSGLQQMGAEIVYGEDYVEATAATLHGADIELPFASVGATENLLMAAVTARGRTRLANVAREPEITDLAAYLSAMGARIEGAGTPEITVEGVGELHAADHVVVPDRIEAGTFAVAAALTGGDLRVEEAVPGHLGLPLEKLRAIGAEVVEEERGFTVRRDGPLRPADIVTLPYPGFPTDLQPQFLVLLSQAQGTSIMTENVFDGRFSIIEELRRMGADVALEGHHALLRGPRALRGTTVRATDLRAGAALVLAGLVAEGETVVTDPYHVDRGYQDLAGRLRALGADVERTPGAPLAADLAAGVA